MSRRELLIHQSTDVGWVLFIFLGVVGLATLFVILTDGRYFGKRLTAWIYDRFGPAIFGARSEADRWRNLARVLHLCGDEVILDVGTAVGDLPLAIAALPGFRGQVFGVDWSARMIAAAQSEAHRRGLGDRTVFQVADVRQALHVDSGTFDVVFCLGLLETLPEQEQVLRELVRVLEPGGALVLSLYRGWDGAHTTLSLDWYRRHLSVLGLRDLEVVPCRRNQDVVIARS